MTHKTSHNFSANGKLLISGEYLIMEGALGLAVPLQYGQSLTVTETNTDDSVLKWKSQYKNQTWFSAELSSKDFSIHKTNHKERAAIIQKIIKEIKYLNTSFLDNYNSFDVIINSDFDPEWGFGSSSALIVNLSKWAKVDPYVLNDKIFGGSGYDIAAAKAKTPIIYQKEDGKRNIVPVDFDPPFCDQLFFVYLGKKQNSAKEIQTFYQTACFTPSDIKFVSTLTQKMLSAKKINEFSDLVVEHEDCLSRILKQEKVKNALFSDFPGQVKSLGAWGGDFALFVSPFPENKLRAWLSNKGYTTVFPFKSSVKHSDRNENHHVVASR